MSRTTNIRMSADNVRVMSLDEAFELLKVRNLKKTRFERVALAVFSPDDPTNLQAIVVSEQAQLG